MRVRNLLQAMLVVCALGAGGCSKAPGTAPKTVTPPAVVTTDYEYDVRFTYTDRGYTVRRFEYADPSGVVKNAVYQTTPWKQTLTLKPGDRMYVRAEVDFPSGVAGGIQIVGPPGFYRSASVERLDGPATAVLVIDEIVK